MFLPTLDSRSDENKTRTSRNHSGCHYAYPPSGKPTMHASKPAILEGLRQQLERIERAQGAKTNGSSVLPFGIAALDELWPQGGLPRGAVHEVACATNGVAAATGFTASIAG